MIKTTPDGRKIVEYGDGDIFGMSLSNKDIVGLALYTGEKGEIGRSLPELTKEEGTDVIENKAEVLLVFKNIESLEVAIKNLQSIRRYFG